ncbi:glycosyltransferase family 2 protein [Paracoccus luteus]|uniref:glycosyltransferase family 2 protein n=1 Tax=Paracoccus luteus TaxID=2508543 RepID=UPI00106FAC2C|nr:glycosyltransferase family 2 protein [Paracoccus luteus]
MKNTTYEVMRFVSWYLELGASRIYIVFHDPDDRHIAMLAGHPKIECLPFTDNLRAAMEVAPDDPKPPQIVAGTYLYPRITEDWLLRVDCDELVYCETGRLSERLAEIPPEIETVVIRPAEQLSNDHGPGWHLFRLPMDEQTISAVYGDAADMMAKRQGLMSHAFGKSAHRTGLGDLLVQEHNGIHPSTNKRTRNRKWAKESGVFLLHFNSQDFEAWGSAALRRSRNSSFGPELSGRILAAAGAEEGDGELKALYHRINHFDAQRAESLINLGAGRRVFMDFDTVISKHFGEDHALSAPATRPQ